MQYYGPSGATIWSSPDARFEAQAGLRGHRQWILRARHQNRRCDHRDGHGDGQRSVEPADHARHVQLGLRGDGTAKGNCPENAGTDVDLGGSPILVDLGGGKQMLVQGRNRPRCMGWIPTRTARSCGPRGLAWAARAAAFSGVSLPATGWCSRPWVNRRAAHRRPCENGAVRARSGHGKFVWNEPAPVPKCAGQRGCSVSQKSPPTAIPGVVFSPSMDGHVRAHDTKTGKIIWDFDTRSSFRP